MEFYKVERTRDGKWVVVDVTTRYTVSQKFVSKTTARWYAEALESGR